jgi:hypothetical protein
MFNFHYLDKRVVMSQRDGMLTISIRRRNDHATYIIMLVVFTAGLIGFLTILIPAFPRFRSFSEATYLLLLFGFLVLWFCLGLSFTLWRGFGTEEILVSGDTFRWKRKALCWTRHFRAASCEISDVVSKTPWHGNNGVEFTCRGHRHRIGDRILENEAIAIADALSRELRIQRQEGI